MEQSKSFGLDYLNDCKLNKIVVVLIILLFVKKSYCQLSGTVFLSNQNGHSGIKVKFIANSGTAITDSTLTNASGNYSINISSGVYYIQMIKSGYQTTVYNNNSTVLLTNTTVVNTVTLQPGNLVYVTGTVSGSWTNNNIYIINSDVQVPNGYTLNIQPGTVIKVNGNYSITANGQLNANATNSTPIVFTSNNPSTPIPAWNGLVINSSASILANCIIENGFYGIQCLSASPSLIGNEVRKFYNVGINSGVSALIKGNKVHDFYSYDVSIGINMDGNSLVECNEVYDGNGYGIRPVSSGTVINNIVRNISHLNRGYGIGSTYGSPRIENNVVSGCVKGMVISINVNSQGALVINNTLYNNTDGLMLGWFNDCYSNSIIANNIITDNTNGITTGCSSATPSAISNNCVWNNSINYNNIPLTGLGQTVSTNANGDPIDSYFNISLDPLYSGGPPNLTANSPCINAGNQDYSANIGCNTSLLCNNPITGMGSNGRVFEVSVYPNPFLDQVFIHSTINQTFNVKVINIHGGLVANGVSLSNNSVINLRDLPFGIYFLIIKNQTLSESIKIIKQ